MRFLLAVFSLFSLSLQGASDQVCKKLFPGGLTATFRVVPERPGRRAEVELKTSLQEDGPSTESLVKQLHHGLVSRYLGDQHIAKRTNYCARRVLLTEGGPFFTVLINRFYITSRIGWREFQDEPEEEFVGQSLYTFIDELFSSFISGGFIMEEGDQTPEFHR